MKESWFRTDRLTVTLKPDGAFSAAVHMQGSTSTFVGTWKVEKGELVVASHWDERPAQLMRWRLKLTKRGGVICGEGTSVHSDPIMIKDKELSFQVRFLKKAN